MGSRVPLGWLSIKKPRCRGKNELAASTGAV